MTSFLIIGEENVKRDEKIQDLLTLFHVNPIDVTTLSMDGTSIGVEHVRQMQAKLMLRPIRSPAKAALITQGESLTIPAQNALLKTLEEPPEHTIIIIACNSASTILSTIKSRCQLLYTAAENEDITSFLILLENLPQMGVDGRLATADVWAKNNVDALARIRSFLRGIESAIQRTNDTNQRRMLLAAGQRAQETYKVLRDTNTNTRLSLEHFFLTVFPLP